MFFFKNLLKQNIRNFSSKTGHYSQNENLKLILIRHGQSIWNQESKFTGWTDIPLSKKGVMEANAMGNKLKQMNLIPKAIFTSSLSRAIETSLLIRRKLISNFLEHEKGEKEENINNLIPIDTSWRLNEKHYGYLDGIEREYVRKTYGKHFTKNMRNSFEMIPPIVKNNNPLHLYNKYENIYLLDHPRGESKKMLLNRFLPYWNSTLWSNLLDKNIIMICTHKHTARVLMKYLKNIPNDDFKNYQIPEKKMLLLEMDTNQKLINETEIDFNLD